MKALKKLLAVAALSLPLATFAQEAAKPAEPPKPADPPKISVTPYGIAHLGAIWNSGVFTGQEYPSYVLSEDEGSNTVTARQSRFGVNAVVPLENILGATLTGKIEADFMGGVTATNAATGVTTSFTSALVRLRHAYMAAAIAAGPGKLVITAGQTDSLVNALHPESTTYLGLPMFQQAGNIHRRTPQLRLGYDFAGDAFGLKVEAALLDPTYGQSNGTVAAADPANNAGNRSGMGDIEARAGFTLKPISGIGGTIGVSYLTGTRTYGTPTGGTTTDVSTSALGVDFMFDLTQYLSLRGEYYQGEGIDDAFAGIASVSFVGTDGVKSDGYWAQAIIKPHAVIHLLAGLGNETVDDATYPAAADGSTQRLQNDMMHFGLLVNMNKAWRVGVEYASTTTKSRAGTAADPNATAELTGTAMSLSTQLRF